MVSMEFMFLEYTYSRVKKDEIEKEAMEKGMRPILVCTTRGPARCLPMTSGGKACKGRLPSASCGTSRTWDMRDATWS